MKSHHYKLIIFCSLLAALVGIFLFTDIRLLLDFDFLMSKKDAFLALGIFGGLVFVGFYVLIAPFYLPMNPLSIFAGYLFGFGLGGTIAYVGGILNMLIAYFIARYFLRSYFQRLSEHSEKMARISEELDTKGVIYLFYARIFFMTPYNLLNIVCGISNMSFGRYMLATLCGSVLQAYFYAYVGSQITNMTNSGDFWKQGLILSIVLIAFFLLIGWGRKRLS